MILVSSGLHLVRSAARCWQCGVAQPVIGLGTDGVLEDSDCDHSELQPSTAFTLLSYVETMPEDVYRFVSNAQPRYRKFYSRTVDAEYFRNICTCGAAFGDWYLFAEPGGAFFPESEEAAKLIRRTRMPFDRVLEFCCLWSQGPGDLIRDHGFAE
jgi:hypothetical protein